MLFKGSMIGNDSSQGPQRFLFFDTETHRERVDAGRLTSILPLRLGCWKSGRPEGGKLTRIHGGVFRTPDEFWASVWGECSRKQTLWMMAHNVAFDLTTLHFWELWEKGIVSADMPNKPRDESKKTGNDRYSGGMLVIDNPPFILTLKHNATGGRIAIVDSFNYFRSSLAAMGKACGLPKFTMPEHDMSDSEWESYCWRDVEILERTFCQLSQWLKDSDFGCMKYTAAMQSMAAFRHRFMPLSTEYEAKGDKDGKGKGRKRRIGLINFGHDNSVKTFERSAYFGGRVELFSVGQLTVDCHCLDVTSLYPSAMVQGRFPFRLREYHEPGDNFALLAATQPADCIARVYLETERETYPVRYNNMVCHCRGKFWTTLAGPELDYAFRRGHVVKVSQFSEYHCADLFTSFVSSLWKMRKDYINSGNELYADFVKILLNSLHGKFGQRSPEWVDRPEKIAQEPWTKWTMFDMSTGQARAFRALGYLVQESVDRGETSRSFPAIPAFITSRGRQIMRRFIGIAAEANVYSISTDCVWVNSEGLLRLQVADAIADNELGKLRLLYSTDDIEFISSNCYRVGDELTVSGLRKDATKVSPNSYRETHFETTAGMFAGVCPEVVTAREIIKRLPCRYTKAEVYADGSVEPFTLNESSSLKGIS